MKNPRRVNKKTASDLLFEKYLGSRGLGFDYEGDVPGSTKHPDYRVQLGSEDVYFEVKEFEAPTLSPGRDVVIGHCDPYVRLRAKIDGARKQFKGLKGKPCALVLANPNGAIVDLQPFIVFGAMLGNCGWKIPFDPRRGRLLADERRPSFNRDGRLRNEVNTTISAVCTIGFVGVDSRRVSIAARLRARELGRDLRVEEYMAIWEETDENTAEIQSNLNLIVHQNPFAVAPFPQDLAGGPYDERFAMVYGRPKRVFVGDLLAQLEREERAAGIEQDDPLGMRFGSPS